MDNKQRLSATLSDEHTVAVASRNDISKEMRILVGRYCHTGNRDWRSCYEPNLRKGPQATVNVVVNNYPYGNSARVEIQQIPGNDNKPAPLLAPIIVSSEAKTVTNGRLIFNIPNFEDEDAYNVVIKPATAP